MLNTFARQGGGLLSDLIAGATLAIIKVPQAMANAVLASVNPVAGLYALMVAMPVGALLSSSAFMNISTTGVLAIAAGEALYGLPDEEKTGALVLLVFLIGIIQLILGLLGVGRLTRYISNSVMTGFMLGVAVLILITSIRDITGYDSERSGHLLRLAETTLNWRHFDVIAVMIGLTTIAVTFLVERTPLRKFALVLALPAATALGIAVDGMFEEQMVMRIGDVAYISSLRTVPLLPGVDWLAEMLLPAFTIAIIGMVQTTGVTQTFPNPDGRFPDTSKVFVSLGAANAAASFFGAIPASGSLSGTTILLNSGARSRWANVFAAVIVLGIGLSLIGLVSLIPVAAMGGLLFVIGLQNIQPAQMREIWSTGFVSRAALGGTTLATLLLPLHFAILAGISLSFFLQVLRLANCLEIRQWRLVEGGFPIDLPVPQRLEENEVCVAYTKGVLFFASAQSIEEKLPLPASGAPAVLVLVLRDMDELGSTVIRSLIQYARSLKKAGNKLVLAGINDALLQQLERTSLFDTLDKDDLYTEQEAFGAGVNQAVLQSRAWIEAQTQSLANK